MALVRYRTSKECIVERATATEASIGGEATSPSLGAAAIPVTLGIAPALADANVVQGFSVARGELHGCAQHTMIGG